MNIKEKMLKYLQSPYRIYIGIALLVLGIIGIVFIFWPSATYVFHNENTVPYPSKTFSDKEVINKSIPRDNRLVIPKIDVDINIVEGNDESVLWNGAWHYPGTADPGEPGATLITGHRLQFLPPNKRTFYLLDKVEVGDVIVVYWNESEFGYKVDKIYEVEESQMEILERGDEEMLRLFTCTPLLSQSKRLVVEAKPLL